MHLPPLFLFPFFSGCYWAFSRVLPARLGSCSRCCCSPGESAHPPVRGVGCIGMSALIRPRNLSSSSSSSSSSSVSCNGYGRHQSGASQRLPAPLRQSSSSSLRLFFPIVAIRSPPPASPISVNTNRQQQSAFRTKSTNVQQDTAALLPQPAFAHDGHEPHQHDQSFFSRTDSNRSYFNNVF